jgi:NADH-quinone oxidoreductase subunit D
MILKLLRNHIKYYSKNTVVPIGETYTATEAPKGEFGVYLISNVTNKPYRCKIKVLGFGDLQALNAIFVNHLIADVITIIRTQGIAFCEIDR